MCDGRLVCPFHGFEYVADRPVRGDALRSCRPSLGAPETVLRDPGTRRHDIRVVGAPVAARRNGSFRKNGNSRDGWSRIRLRTIRMSGHIPGDDRKLGGPGPPPLCARLRKRASATARLMPSTAPICGVASNSRPGSPSRDPLNTVFDVATVTHVHGLGYSQVDFEERSASAIRARLWVLSTPVDGTLDRADAGEPGG